MKIASIVGARPQFIKLAPLVRAIREHNKLKLKPKIEHLIIHTGQHYDYEMTKIFFDELGIPVPNHNLEVGSGTHGWQTGEMIKRAEAVLMTENPDWVVVYGDTNSTVAGALAAAKLHIPVAHIEAGLRSYNKKMPEEINRILADNCSNILFCPTENAVKNLKKEGFINIINNGKLVDLSSNKFPIISSRLPTVINVGDIMFDALIMNLSIAEKKSTILKKLNLKPNEYFLATVHRAENTDNPEKLKSIFEAFNKISRDNFKIILPLHPRVKKQLYKKIHPSNYLLILEPVSYLDMLVLEKHSRAILTDSGGVQKEAYFFHVPCISLREETEWVETVASGWNTLAGTDIEKIIYSVHNLKMGRSTFKYGDGHVAKRIVNIISREFI